MSSRENGIERTLTRVTPKNKWSGRAREPHLKEAADCENIEVDRDDEPVRDDRACSGLCSRPVQREQDLMTFARVMTALALAFLVACGADARPRTSMDRVQLEGGCFEMGSERGYPEEGPVREACVASFAMARTEVTNAQFAEFVEATGFVTRAERGWSADDPAGPGVNVLPGGAVFIAPRYEPVAELSWWRLVEGANWRWPTGPAGPAAREDDPVVQITLEDASAFAAWAGGRLPTEAEWEYAAKADLTWDDATIRAAREKANTWQGIFPLVDTGDDGFAGIAPVASYPPNAFGLHDMIGNVWEWTATPYAPGHGPEAIGLAADKGWDPHQPGVPVGVVKGGSFLCATSYCVRFRPAARQAQDLAFSTSHVGFRVAWDR